MSGLIYNLLMNATPYLNTINQVVARSKIAQGAVNALKLAARTLPGAAGGAFQNLQSAGAGIFSIFRKISTVALSVVAVIGIIASAAHRIGTMVHGLMKMAAEYDLIKMSMEGYYQSGSKAAQMMLYLDRYASKSAYSLTELAKSANALSAAGLDVNRFLPIAEKLSLALGELKPENLEHVIGILRRIKGGQITLGMGPRGLGRFGIGKDLLAQYGAKFSASGSFIGKVSDAMSIIEEVVQDRFGKVMKLIESSPAVVLSNANDAFERALRSIGRELNFAFLPIIQKATDALNALVENGVIKSVGESIASMWDLTTGEDMMSTMIEVAAMFEGVSAALRSIYNLIVRTLQIIAPGIGKTILGIPTSAYETAYHNAKRRMEGMLYAYSKGKKKRKGSGAPDGAPELPFDDLELEGMGGDPQLPVLRAIERNTKEALQIQRNVFGGGDAARTLGTPMEIHGIKKSMSGGYRGFRTASAVGTVISDLIVRLVEEMVADDRVRYQRGRA